MRTRNCHSLSLQLPTFYYLNSNTYKMCCIQPIVKHQNNFVLHRVFRCISQVFSINSALNLHSLFSPVSQRILQSLLNFFLLLCCILSIQDSRYSGSQSYIFKTVFELINKIIDLYVFTCEKLGGSTWRFVRCT
ncbi:hypothetical protein D915_010488 [Fasciola hepatica]|uniref:Uncharacterized protein n=1 Tax=Fasciola hepatica TaxID=6192 RepID=A0A4E0QWH2_FASHE|nr:hypothetical protein D915_010488 [Fasciola hepatica]